MQPVKLAMPQASHMQSVKVIEQSNDKKSQVKLVMAQSTHMQSSKQPEIIWNSYKHEALPTHDLNVFQQAMFQDSTSKYWYPDVSANLSPDSRSYKITTMQSVNPVKMQSTHMQPVKSEVKKKSQVNTKSQEQTSKFKKNTKPQVKLDL